MEKFPTVKHAIWLLMVLWFIEVIWIVITSITLFEIGIDNNRFTMIFGIAGGVGVMWWGWRKTGASFSSVFPLSKIRVMLIFPIFVTVVGVGIVTSKIENVIRFFIPLPDAMASALNMMMRDTSLLYLLLVTVVAAAFLEEALFRGLILYGFLRNYHLKKALMWSEILFLMMHLNPWQFPGTFLMGIVFGWWVVQTQSLWAGILGHILYNGIAVILFYYNLPGLTMDLTKPVVFQPWWLDVSGLLLTACGLFWFYRLTSNCGSGNTECGKESACTKSP